MSDTENEAQDHGGPIIPLRLCPTDQVEWSTPQDLFDMLDDEFHFTLDPCATPENAKCAKYFTVLDDGLNQDWGGQDSRVFMNPPWPLVDQWMEKANQESMRGATIVCLVPTETEAMWWLTLVDTFREVAFLVPPYPPAAIVVLRPTWLSWTLLDGAMDIAIDQRDYYTRWQRKGGYE